MTKSKRDLPFTSVKDLSFLVQKCYQAVSTIGEQHPNTDASVFHDIRLLEAFQMYCQNRPQNLPWADRRDIDNALTYGAISHAESTRKHVVMHLVERITRYFTIRLDSELAECADLAGKWMPSDWKFLAKRMANRLTYNEAQAFVLAQANGEDPPAVPNWSKPSKAEEILGKGRVTTAKRRSKDSIRRAALMGNTLVCDKVFQIFNDIAGRVERDDRTALPICRSKMGVDSKWGASYLGIHIFMLRTLEALGQATSSGAGSGSSAPKERAIKRISRAWAIRGVKDLLRKEDGTTVDISRRAVSRLAAALQRAVKDPNSRISDSLSKGISRGRQKHRRAEISLDLITKARTVAQATQKAITDGTLMEPSWK
ncbi:hypothetical protein DFS34DRAFT_283375 [Phlyctochytrium arcticum]|nr:hypothetical protein DFS34DRAFT_283375 [Phlyctochytrium arcticum]